MKKNWKTPKYKAYMREHARKSHAAQLRLKEHRRRKRRHQQGTPKAVLKLRNRYAHYKHRFAFIKAPQEMRFVGNPEEMCKFIGRLNASFKARRPVYVVLRDVEAIDYDGITVLLSVMVRFKSNNIKFNGDFPRDPSVKALLHESDFFKHLNLDDIKEADEYELTQKSSILTHAMRTVDSLLAEKIIGKATMTVWGEQRRCPGVQRTLIELMQNTIDHASLDTEGEKHWWLSVNHLPEQNRVVFSFVDYGVGVFENLKGRSSEKQGVIGRLIQQARERLAALLSSSTNADVLRMVFTGELHKTVTGKYYRGKGLPGIYEALRKNKISNLAMITNDVFFNSHTGAYHTLGTPFEGTFVSWELRSENASLDHVAS